jgi:UDP-N-acetylmuramoylalanine--D-glutamate ligase
MRVVVVGLAVTGDAVVRHARAAGDQVTVVDDTPAGTPAYAERVAGVRAAGAKVVEHPSGTALRDLVATADLLVPSPGVPQHHAVIAAARAAGVPVRSEIDLAAERSRVPIVAITGTNGKTTVTSLVAAMLEASGVDAVAAGNIGLPLLDAVTSGHDVVAAEVSSFQLAFTTAAFRPRVAVLLNLAPDHLDWHGSFTAYVAAKARVFRYQGGDDQLVFNADDAEVARLAADAPAGRVPFSLRDDAGNGFGVTGDALTGPDGEVISTLATLWSHAPHDQANALAASAAALAVGATPAGVRAALTSFKGLPHRLRLVGERRGVRYYDDSKATNPHATVSAVEAAEGPVVLLAGGRNKGLDLSVLGSLTPRLRAVVAMGDAAAEVEAAFVGATVPVVRANDMRAAVSAAADQARPGDAVVLSPACASFDWYTSYGERGDAFRREMKQLPAPSKASVRGEVAE